MTTTTTPVDMDSETFARVMVDAMRRLPALDPDGEMWCSRLRWARAQSPTLAAFFQFSRAQVSRTVEARQAFAPRPCPPVSVRPRHVRRKKVGRYAVPLWIVGPSLCSAPGWRKVVRP